MYRFVVIETLLIWRHRINIISTYCINKSIISIKIFYAFPETVFLCCDLNIWSRDKRKTVLKRVFHGLSNEVLNDKIHRLPHFGVRTYGIFKKTDFEM